jgi:hypothetical protein
MADALESPSAGDDDALPFSGIEVRSMREFLIPAAIFVASHVAIFAIALPIYAIGQ